MKADWEAPVVHDALLIAITAHAGQVDKAGFPYIEHPRRMAARLIRSGEPCEDVAAALLHDVLEDTPMTRQLLAECGIPSPVLDVVEILTHRKGEPYADYMDRVCSDFRAAKVKLADIRDNMSDIRLARLDDGTRERLRAKYAPQIARLRAVR